MRKVVVVFLMFAATAARATVRCPGTSMQTLTVASGETFTLPVVPVAGVLDYEVARAADWTRNPAETWALSGSVAVRRIRQESGAPTVKGQLHNTFPRFPSAAYYVVTATNAFDSAFHPCAQDYLVSVSPDPLLSRDSLRAVVPVAGSLKGANNSTYRTRLTLENMWAQEISGKIVFHPSGRSAASTDPALSYSLGPEAVLSWEDIVAAIPASGLGSLDIVADLNEWGGYPMPKIRAQIVSIAPSGGSFGTDVPAITMESEEYGAVWTDLAPASIVVNDQNGAKRLAVGVRTLADSVEITVTVETQDGVSHVLSSRTLPADYHEQQPLSAFLDGFVVHPNDRVVIYASRKSAPEITGGAIIYLTETDNVTNDVSLFVPKQNGDFLKPPMVECYLGCRFLR